MAKKTKDKKKTPPKPNLEKAKWIYDVEERDEWIAPDIDDPDFGAKLMTMPNIPLPLHHVNPRNIMGQSKWDVIRRMCYRRADDTCEVCGAHPEDKRKRQAHEVYDIDYRTGTVTFKRVVCLCYDCHVLGIHSGRALTLFKKGSPLMTKDAILHGAEHLFQILDAYNKLHPDDEPLRAYYTMLSYIDHPELHDEMTELAAKYHIKFWKENEDAGSKWGDWKLVIGDKEFPTPYEDYSAWELAMAEANAKADRQGTIQTTEAQEKLNDLLKFLDKKA